MILKWGGGGVDTIWWTMNSKWNAIKANECRELNFRCLKKEDHICRSVWNEQWNQEKGINQWYSSKIPIGNRLKLFQKYPEKSMFSKTFISEIYLRFTLLHLVFDNYSFRGNLFKTTFCSLLKKVQPLRNILANL